MQLRLSCGLQSVSIPSVTYRQRTPGRCQLARLSKWSGCLRSAEVKRTPSLNKSYPWLSCRARWLIRRELTLPVSWNTWQMSLMWMMIHFWRISKCYLRRSSSMTHTSWRSFWSNSRLLRSNHSLILQARPKSPKWFNRFLMALRSTRNSHWR